MQCQGKYVQIHGAEPLKMTTSAKWHGYDEGYTKMIQAFTHCWDDFISQFLGSL